MFSFKGYSRDCSEMEDTDEKCLFVHGGNLLYLTCESAGMVSLLPRCRVSRVWQILFGNYFPKHRQKAIIWPKLRAVDDSG